MKEEISGWLNFIRLRRNQRLSHESNTRTGVKLDRSFFSFFFFLCFPCGSEQLCLVARIGCVVLGKGLAGWICFFFFVLRVYTYQFPSSQLVQTMGRVNKNIELRNMYNDAIHNWISERICT